MTKKITKLTPAQESRMKVVLADWLGVGRSTEAINRPAAEAAITAMYREIGKEKPMFFWTPSPLQCMLGLAATKIMLKKDMPATLRQNLEQNLEQNLGQNLWQNLEQNLRQNLWQNLGQNLRQNLWQNLDWDYFAGNLWCAWSIFHDFCNEIGVPYSQKDRSILDAWIEQYRHCHFWWPYEGIVFLSERPVHLKVDERGLLHCENDMAIRYADGYGLYHWHGVSIPKEWIEDKASLTSKIALTWENMEQCRAACEILGWDNVLRELDAKTVQKDDNEQIGELLEVDMPNVGKEKFLRVTCGTGRKFAIPVPPSMKTAREANAWTYGLSPEDYQPEVRT